MPFLHPDVMDGGLQVLTDDINQLHFLTEDPIDYDDALAVSVGVKTSPMVSAPQDRAGISSPDDGRMVEVAAVSGVATTGSGIISYWAALDTVGMRLLAAGTVVVPTAVRITVDTITASSFEIGIPAQ